MRDVLKNIVTDYCYSNGIIQRVLNVSEEPIAYYCKLFLHYMLNPSIKYMDFDHPDWIQGVQVLEYFGVLSQEEIDEIESLYIEPSQITFVSKQKDNNQWLVTFSNGITNFSTLLNVTDEKINEEILKITGGN